MSDLARAGIERLLLDWEEAFRPDGERRLLGEQWTELLDLCERIRDEARADTEAVSQSLISDLRDELRVHVERWNDDQATIAERAAELARLREAVKDGETYKTAMMAAGNEVARLRGALQRADSYLSLLRHHCARQIPWGSVGVPTEYDVDQVIGQIRALLAEGQP